MLQTINVRGDVIDYVTANINRLEHQLQLLQEAVNSKRLTLTEKTAQEAVSPDAFTLLFDLRIEQRLLNQQQRLLRRAQRAFTHRGAVQAVTDLLQLLRRGVHRVLHAFGLSLQ